MPNDAGHPLTRAEGSRRRTRRAVAVLLGLALLGGVGTLAAFTGTATKPTPAAGATRAAVAPPEVVFADASDGWAFYPDCHRVLPTDACPPELFHSTDGGASWRSVDLPIGAPTVPSLWGQLQVRGATLALPWQYGVFLSTDAGVTWTAPTLHGGTAVLPADSFVVREGEQEVLASPAADTAEALLPPIPVTTPWELGVVAPDHAWIRDATTFAVTVTAGRAWHDTVVSSNDLELVVATPTGDRLARLQVAVDATTLGVAGDGGEYPVRGVVVSTDAGLTWQATAVSGPMANAACTVMLADGSLLGVAVDGKQLLRLPRGATSFVPVTSGPATVPACLSANAGQVYGPTLDNHVVLSSDGVHWTTHALATRVLVPTATS
ncbi:hypothetical protein acdb102_12580 [Acidothermaceae bacterium B102]|nr:hypothetical protein acdb102_12580 [Acidothermaceae bacterium B102]